MKKEAFPLALVFALALTIPYMSLSQSITLKVTNEKGDAIASAWVLKVPDSVQISLNSEGIALVNPGTYFVQQLGFRSVTITVDKDSKNLTLQLEADPLILGQVLVNGLANQSELIKQPKAISILERMQIRNSSLPQYAMMMNSIPGVFMHSGSINTNRLIIRGIGSRSSFDTEKVRAYLGNIPLTNGSGQTTIEDLDLNFIGQIEVLKGPSGSQYGSGLGGTLLLNMDQSKQDKPLSLTLSSQIGSYGYRQLSTKGTIIKSAHQLNLGLQNTSSDGYRDNNELNRNSFFINHSFQGKKWVQQTVAYGLQQKAYIPSSLNQTALDEDRTQAAANWGAAKGFEDYTKFMLGTTSDVQLTPLFSVSASAFVTQFDNYEPRPFNILDESTIGWGTRNRLIYDGEKSTLILGQEFFSDNHQFSTFQNLYRENNGEGSLQGNQLSNLQENRKYLNVFAYFETNLTQKIQLTSGLNLNKTSYDLADNLADATQDLTGSYQFESIWSPSISLAYQHTTNQNSYLSFNHGFSPPTLEETLTPDGQINPDIAPEQGYQLAIGYKRFGQRGFLSIEAYQMWVQDLLVARRTAEDQFVGINAGETSHMGIELEWNQTWVNKDDVQLTHRLRGMMGRFRFVDFIEEEINYNKNNLPGVPEHTFSQDVELIYKKWSGLVTHQLMGSMYIDDANTLSNDAFQLITMRLDRRLDINQWKINAGVTINNLLNSEYNSMVLVNAVGFGGSEPRYYYPGLPRNFLFHLNLSFN